MRQRTSQRDRTEAAKICRARALVPLVECLSVEDSVSYFSVPSTNAATPNQTYELALHFNGIQQQNQFNCSQARLFVPVPITLVMVSGASMPLLVFWLKSELPPLALDKEPVR